MRFTYPKAFIAALCLHVVILLLGGIRPSTRPLTPVTDNIPVVQAVAVDAKKVDAQIRKIKNEQAQKVRQERLARARQLRQKKRLEQQAKALKAKAAQEKKKLSALKKQQSQERVRLAKLKKAKALTAKKVQQAKQEKALAQKQALAAKKAQVESLEKARKAERARELAEKAAADERRRQIRLSRLQGEINRHKVLILKTLSENWNRPSGLDDKLIVEFKIRVAPDGSILQVDLLKSSGNMMLDRSAKTAIYKSSPLPVPKNIDAFKLFRTLHLTVRPEGFIT